MEGTYCAIDDDMQDFYPKVLKADAMIVGTPKNTSKMTWKWKPFLDRLRAFLEGRFFGLAGPTGPRIFNKIVSSTSFIWPGLENVTIRIIGPTLFLGMVPVGPVSNEFNEDDPQIPSKGELVERAGRLGKRVARITRDLKAGREVAREMPAYV